MRDDGERGHDSVRIRPHRRERLLQAQYMMVGVAVAFIANQERVAPSLRLSGVVLGLGLVCYIVVAIVRERLELYPDRLVATTAFSSTTLTWADVAALRVEWFASSLTGGFHLDAEPSPGARKWDHRLRLLARDADTVIADYVERHGIDALVNPRKPWVDRFGRWHGDGLQSDPLETIRSIRRAAVGPWIVRVRPVDGGFSVVTETARGGNVITQSEVLPDRRAAVDEGVAQVKKAQAMLADAGQK